MQTIPIATTPPGGEAQAAAGATGAAGPDVAGLFANLVYALAAGAQPPAQAAAVGSSNAGPAGEGDAAAADGGAQADEGGNGEAVVAVLVPQLQNLEYPGAAPAGVAPDGAAAPNPLVANLSGEAPDAASPLAGQPATVVADPVVAGADADTAASPPAQAVELAKVLGAGTQVQVIRAAAEAAPATQPVQGLAGAAVAAALAEAAPAAAPAEPVRRPAASEAKKALPGNAIPLTPCTGGAADEPATAAVAASGSPSAPPGKAQAAAPAARQAPAGASTTGSAATVFNAGDAAAPLAEASASTARESLPGQGQLPAPPLSGNTQPSAPPPERAPAPTLPVPPQAGQVSVHIAKAVRTGLDRIHIQLEPASLGRVEIRLDLSDTQHVRAAISAETAEALELLRADARGLERALQDAGLKTDPGSLSFQLRDQGARAGHDGSSRQGYGAQPRGGADGEDSGASPLVETPARAPAPSAALGAGRIDIHA